MHNELTLAQLRHRAERPLIALSLLLTIVVLAIAALITFSVDVQHALKLPPAQVDDVAAMIALAPVMPLTIAISKLYMAAKVRANGVKAGPNQFPELFEKYKSLAEKIGVSKIPDLYVINGNGIVNAFALSCNSRRNYVVVHAEIARLSDTSPEVVDFVMAHELGHHKLRHVSLFRNLLQVIPSFLVLPGRALSRAQEYSADRVAVSVCSSCVSGMGLLTVGPYMENRLNVEAYREQVISENGSWFVRFVHWFSDHAVNVKRAKAIIDLEERGFERHGSIF